RESGMLSGVRRETRADIRGSRHHIVIPLLVLPQRVVGDEEADIEAVYLQSIHIAQPQVREVGDQLAVYPASYPTVALARRVRLEHVLEAIPATQLRDELGSGDKVRAEGMRQARVGL